MPKPKRQSGQISGPATSVMWMKRILHRCRKLFYAASLALILRIDLLSGVSEDREDFGAFQYNNVMYSAVGECIGRANDSTWEGVISNSIFKPLGMTASNTSMQEMRDSPDFTVGYHLPGKNPRPEKDHDLNNVAASGGINSNARDMAQWIRLTLGRGVLDGKRLISDAGFHQFITPG